MVLSVQSRRCSTILKVCSGDLCFCNLHFTVYAQVLVVLLQGYFCPFWYQRDLTSLISLHVLRHSNFLSFTWGLLLLNLTQIFIFNCDNLKSLPEQVRLFHPFLGGLEMYSVTTEGICTSIQKSLTSMQVKLIALMPEGLGSTLHSWKIDDLELP